MPRENATKIAGHISRLLGHYWAATEDPRLRQALAEDWLSDLREFDEAIVADACQAWRRTESKRPAIADIRARCLEERELRQRSQVLAPPNYSAMDAITRNNRLRYDEAAVQREKWAHEHGCDSFVQAMAIGLQSVGQRKTA